MSAAPKRSGAIRKSKKGPSVGTGGYGRKALEGKGPTPKAEDRPYHKAFKNKELAERSAAKRGPSKGGAAPRGRSTGGRRRTAKSWSPVATPSSKHCEPASPPRRYTWPSASTWMSAYVIP